MADFRHASLATPDERTKISVDGYSSALSPSTSLRKNDPSDSPF